MARGTLTLAREAAVGRRGAAMEAAEAGACPGALGEEALEALGVAALEAAAAAAAASLQSSLRCSLQLRGEALLAGEVLVCGSCAEWGCPPDTFP
jgi:hypothetical protein